MAKKQDATGEEQDLGLTEEDRLPWLEAADDFEEEGEVSPVRLLAMVLGGLILIGAVLGGLWWIQNGGTRGGQGELIAAQQGDYKVAPTDDAARTFEGEGDASFAVSEGGAPAAKVDPSRMPEEPAVSPEAQAEAAAKAAEAKPAAAKAKESDTAEKPAAKMAAAPGTIQLGAFSSEGAANKAWASLSKRFTYLGELNRSVSPAKIDGGTVYRLRVSAGSGTKAAELCGKLRVAGENCVVVR
ncbi:SPOR domain-containing protein [Sphingopyxis sp. MWB1]|uniref:SPOR domain-containing protein n=1 Tax=Sphingopyxis sp. MWB1 TaxID=1537715 RepID=UPI000691F824|nr:SPOR domain-containing protein [Sphingopyxis sp. MWB1]